MADGKVQFPTSGGAFVGHEEGTVEAPRAPFLDSPGTHAPLQTGADGLNVRTKYGETGIPEGGGR
jgi:hypothetical protein